jgi:hypothetical protein
MQCVSNVSRCCCGLNFLTVHVGFEGMILGNVTCEIQVLTGHSQATQQHGIKSLKLGKVTELTLL